MNSERKTKNQSKHFTLIHKKFIFFLANRIKEYIYLYIFFIDRHTTLSYNIHICINTIIHQRTNYTHRNTDTH